MDDKKKSQGPFILWNSEGRCMGFHEASDRDHYGTRGGYLLVPESVAKVALTLLGLVEAMEWSGDDVFYDDSEHCCPSCKEWKSAGKHAAECNLVAAIAAAKGAV